MQSKRFAVPYDHPIDPVVHGQVVQILQDIETTHDVEILFACESGSRGWGFASPDSDYDVRFVYVHRLPWYLSVEPGRDVIELPISNDLDINGWELRKALGLLRRSNPTLLEWLGSPILYREDPQRLAPMRELAGRFFSPRHVRSHYLSMARKNFRGYLQGEQVRLKKYLYVLRPVLAAQWIERGLGWPPMRFADLVDALVEDNALLDEIRRLLDIKMRAGEAEDSPRWPVIHAFLSNELARTTQDSRYEKPDVDEAALNRFLFETVCAFE